MQFQQQKASKPYIQYIVTEEKNYMYGFPTAHVDLIVGIYRHMIK